MVIICYMLWGRSGLWKATFVGLFLCFFLLVGCTASGGVETKDPQFTQDPQILDETHLEQIPGGGSGVLQAAISTSADAIINGINLQRVRQGLIPWVIDPGIVDLAYERTVDMAVREYLDHTDPNNHQVIPEIGLRERGYYGQAAELIFSTEVPLEEVASITLTAWLDDGNHQAVLFSPDYRFAGVGLMGDGQRWIVALLVVEGRE
jgi:uncharacterized protein YkwD